jgi:hypothetical protein
MPDPGPYAIFIELSPTNTFLYIPQLSGDARDDFSAPPGPVRPSRCSIACYTNTRAESRGDLIEGCVGVRDVRVEDVGKIRGVIGALKMEKNMESLDWARSVLTVCEERGLLRGTVSSSL